MYLAYFDDSGTDRRSDVVTVGGVIVKSVDCINLEIHNALVQERIFGDALPGKVELKGEEIFNQNGRYKQCERESCLEGYRSFLDCQTPQIAAVVVASIEKKELAGSAFHSASPLSVAFTLCLPGAQKWMAENDPDGLCIVVFDDTKDQEHKEGLRSAFRRHRIQINPKEWDLPKFMNIHDEMYFGDSLASAGIQAADMIAYVVHRHDSGRIDPNTAKLYGMIEPKIFDKATPFL